MLSVMGTTMKYLFRGILFLIGMVAFCVLLGEPSDTLSWCDVIVIKAIAFLAMVGVFKGYILTLSKKEREDMMNEEV